MKVISNRFIPFSGFAAINLFGVLFVRKNVAVSPRLINHELIHTRQQLELLVVPFYIIYLAEWLCRLFLCRFDSWRAYHSISFEREAYNHEADPAYLSQRRCFSQWRHNLKK